MLVGREAEILRLTARIDDPLLGSGNLRFVQLDGEVGTGKSALLAAVIGRLRERAEARLQVAVPTDAAEPVLPRIFVAHGDRLRVAAPLAAFRVLCEDLLGDSLECLLDTATPAVLARRCLEAIDRAPLVIAVDDVNWLDPASLRFLETLMQYPAHGPVTVLVVHRPGHEPWTLIHAAQRRGALHDHHEVRALPDRMIADLAEELPDHQAAAVVDAANGNPLFAHTAIAGFRRHPDAERVDEALEHVDASRAVVLSSAVAADLDTLTEPARRTIETLAVLGDADAEHIARIADIDQADVRAGARELTDRGLVSTNPHEVLHPVVRFSVYQNTDPARRREFHRRAAGLPDADLFDRAGHLSEMLRIGGGLGGTPQALGEGEIEVLIEAARVAISSNPRASRRWLSDLPPQAQTSQSEILLARSMILTGDFEDAVDRLRTLARQDDSAEVQILLVNALRMTGSVGEARAVLASAHHWADGAESTLLREYIDVLALIDGRAPDELVSRLESLADNSASGLNRAVAAIYRAMTLLSEGQVPHARVVFQRVIEWAGVVPNDELASVPHATCAAVWAAYILDRFALGASLASRALQLARRHGQADVFANLGTGLTFCLASQALLDEADEIGDQAVRDAEQYGPASLVAMARTGLLIAAQGRQDPALLQRRFDDLSRTPVPEFGWFRRAVLTTRVRVSAMLGRPEPCLELLGNPKDAMAALRYADAAVVAAAGGAPETAGTLLAEGMQIAVEQEQHGQRGMILATEAELLLRSGKPLQAGNLFRTARDIFEECDMKLQLWRAQGGIARAEAALAEHAEPLAGLTQRERQIAEVISEGLPNKKIAERLVLSHRTVENHIRNIFKKLGVESRQQIVEMVARSHTAR